MKNLLLFFILPFCFYYAKGQDNITADDARAFIEAHIPEFPVLTAIYYHDGKEFDYKAENPGEAVNEIKIWDSIFNYVVIFPGGSSIAYDGVNVTKIGSISLVKNGTNLVELHLKFKDGYTIKSNVFPPLPSGIWLGNYTSGNTYIANEVVIYLGSAALKDNYPERIKKAFEFLIEKYGGNVHKDKF
jgi:hypothetical protein